MVYDSQQRYNELFPDDATKAKAFDEIAKQYYFCNFGTMQKSDIDVLLFSLYVDQILNQTEENMDTYSDYTLSKYLGITQSRISTLKVKKELKYPYPDFDWKESFLRVLENARYENGKIKVHIPDKNLYLEVKNAIECKKGYIDVSLNTHLLQVPPEYFIDLVLEISDDENKEKMKKDFIKELNEKYHNTQKLEENFESKSIGELIKDNIINIDPDDICDLIKSCIPGIGGITICMLKIVLKLIKQ